MKEVRKPRVHWVSPLPNAQTDIAHYTARILPELSQHTDLVLWTDAKEWNVELERHCEVRHLDPDTIMPRDFASKNSGYGTDTVFVNIGNSWVFHAGLLRLIHRIPCVIILHDLAIQELCRDAVQYKRLPADLYLREMKRWHGEHGAEKAQGLLAGQVDAAELVKEIPGFEMTLDRAISVITHTPAAFEAVSATGTVPVYQLDLPFRPALPKVSEKRADNGPLKLVQFGHIGPNRRLDPILRALAPLKDEIDFRLNIMGKVWDPKYIQARVDALGLNDCVRIHGFVPEQELDTWLAQAHLVFNLRYPTMGEASGSQLRIWSASAAAVVTNLGWYESLQNKTVFKISLENEIDELSNLIRELNSNRQTGERVGRAGRKHLEEHHTPQRYVEGISRIAEQAPRDARSVLMSQTAQRFLKSNATASEIYQTALARHI